MGADEAQVGRVWQGKEGTSRPDMAHHGMAAHREVAEGEAGSTSRRKARPRNQPQKWKPYVFWGLTAPGS